MRKRIMLLSLVVFLASCGMSETRIYSLHMPNPAGSSSAGGGVKGNPGGMNGKPDATIAVLLSSPRYLSQPYIAYRSSPYQLGISKYARWDSSPEEIVQSAFRESLYSSGLFREVRTSRVVPDGFYSLTINLKSFERSDEGGLVFGEIAFEVSLLSPEGKNLYRKSIVKKTQLADRSFLSLARGLSGTLAEGVAEVRSDIGKSLGR